MSAADSNKASSLRERQQAATRDEILATAMRLLQRGDETVSHEVIAKEAGMSARTVYRHFEDRTALMQAIWWKLREMLNITFPQKEEEILPLARTAWASLDEHETLVRSVMAYVGWTLARNQRGFASMMQGADSFTQSLKPLLQGASAKQRKLVVGSFAAIYSAPFWHLLRDRGGLSGPEAQDAVVWMMSVLLEASAKEGKAVRKDKPKKGRKR